MIREEGERTIAPPIRPDRTGSGGTVQAAKCRLLPMAAGVLCIAVLGGGWHAAGAEAGQTREQQEQVLSGEGAWGYDGPHAVIGNATMFVSYLDRSGVTWVAAVDLQSGDVAKKEVWRGNADLHSANPICLRADGRIQVFLDRGSYVDNTIHWRVSVRPWDVSEFGELQESSPQTDVIQGRQFYPLLARSSGHMYLIVNALTDDGIRETVMWRSRDGGDSFGEHSRLWSLAQDLRGNRSYTRAYIEGDDIHLAAVRVGWNELLDGHNIGRVEGVYYTRLDTVEQAFYHADGRHAFDLADAPVYDTQYLDEIWSWEETGRRRRALWADVVAKDGRPYVALAVQDAVAEGESALHDGYWATVDAQGRWRSHRLATLARGWDNTPERKNYAMAIDPQSPETVFVAKSTDVSADLSQVHRMTTTDGGLTWTSVEALSVEGRMTTVVVPQVVDGTPRAVDVLWLDGRMEGWGSYAPKVMMRWRAGAP